MSKGSIPSNYQEAVNFLNGKESKSVPSVRGTKIVKKDNGQVSMYYHNTPVVTWSQDKVTLNSGGYRTVTTKARINQGLIGYKAYVYQHKHLWYLHCQDDNVTIPFTDGISI